MMEECARIIGFIMIALFATAVPLVTGIRIGSMGGIDSESLVGLVLTLGEGWMLFTQMKNKDDDDRLEKSRS